MAVWFRRAVSQSKRRFHQYGFDLDLTYVTPRIIGMCLPTEDLDAIYRNPLSEVVRFLDTFHKDHYKVFNFSMKKYDGLKYFHGNYVHYPFIDHNAPPFSLINTVCIDADAFLKEHPQNVVAFHCKAGKGRTGLMCACLLLYQREFINSHDAIDYYGTARTFNKDGVSIPSQLKYIHYWGNVLNNQRIVGKQSIKLTGIETTPFYWIK
ncbi:phosphatidylinositol-3 [Entamoeba marina]